MSEMKHGGKRSKGMVGNSRKINPDRAGEHKSVQPSGGLGGRKGPGGNLVPTDTYKK